MPGGAEALVVGHRDGVAAQQQALDADALVLDALGEQPRRGAAVGHALGAGCVADDRARAQADPRRSWGPAPCRRPRWPSRRGWWSCRGPGSALRTRLVASSGSSRKLDLLAADHRAVGAGQGGGGLVERGPRRLGDDGAGRRRTECDDGDRRGDRGGEQGDECCDRAGRSEVPDDVMVLPMVGFPPRPDHPAVLGNLLASHIRRVCVTSVTGRPCPSPRAPRRAWPRRPRWRARCRAGAPRAR